MLHLEVSLLEILMIFIVWITSLLLAYFAGVAVARHRTRTDIASLGGRWRHIGTKKQKDSAIVQHLRKVTYPTSDEG